MEVIVELEKEGCFPEGKERPLGGETVPKPNVNEVVVFKDFFTCGIHFLTVRFLHEVVDCFKV